jgi:uncharacterized protein (DUF2252 family)
MGNQERATPVWESMHAFDAELASRAPEAIAAKYEKMSADPYCFYRGAARLFFQDMATGGLLTEHAGAGADVWLAADHGGPGADVWITGDLHLANTGVISLEDKTLIHDMNDFDEAAKGPYLLDVQRLAASIVLAGDAIPLPRETSLAAVESLARGFLEALRDVEAGKLGQRWHWNEENSRGAIKAALDGGHKRRKTELLDRFCDEKKDTLLLKRTEEVVSVPDDLRHQIEAAVPLYICSLDDEWRRHLEEFLVLDVARRLGSGIGSMGLDRFYILTRGKSESHKDARILEWKEERASAVEAALPGAGAGFPDEAVRAVQGAIGLLGERTRLLGYTKIGERPFLVREKSAHKASIELEDLKHPGRLSETAHDTARSIARGQAHSRGADVAAATARTILDAAGADDRFATSLRDFSASYAERTIKDWQSFVKARTASAPRPGT